MATKNKAYAIRQGRDPATMALVENVIVESWPACHRLVHGAPGAMYAGFPTREAAQAWLDGPSRKTVSAVDPPVENAVPDANPGFPSDVLQCYVDGSYNESLPNYGFGLVCLYNGKPVHACGGAGQNREAVSMHQIAGELLGAMHGLRYARQQGYRRVEILHDYMGVAHHATGAWKRTNPFSQTYHDWMQAFFRDNPDIHVTFQKVPAHAGNLFNEMADVLAKQSVGMTPEAKWLEKAKELGFV